MFTEARKIHLIEEVIKTKNEAVLIQLESVVANSIKKSSSAKKKQSIYDFVGILTKKEATRIKKTIEETSEIISADDWK
mgnify:CR=1 FL=1